MAKKPTKPGFYWVCFGREITIVEIDAKFDVWALGSDSPCRIWEVRGKWLGRVKGKPVLKPKR